MSTLETATCNSPSDKINFSVNVGIHVFILFCFLSTFFMMYVSYLVQHAFENELDHLIEGGIKDGYKKLSQSDKDNLKILLKGIPLDRLIKVYNKPSKSVEINNNWLFTFIIYINIFMLLVITASTSILYTSCNQCVPLKEILIENGIIFSIIGGVEFMFFKHVATQYIPVKPSTMIVSAIDSLKKYIK